MQSAFSGAAWHLPDTNGQFAFTPDQATALQKDCAKRHSPQDPGGSGCDANGNCGSGGQDMGPGGGPGGQGCVPGVGCGSGGQFWGPGGVPGGTGCLPGVGCGSGHG